MRGAYTFLPKRYGSQAQHKNVLNPIHLHFAVALLAIRFVISGN
jgi:hypothetical protein